MPKSAAKTVEEFQRGCAAIADLFSGKIATCDPAKRGRRLIKVAAWDKKCSRFESLLQMWTNCIASAIPAAFSDYGRLASAHDLVDKDPVSWSATKIRNLLEPRFGRRPEPTTSPLEPGQDVDSWLAGDSQPHPPLVVWVASVVSGVDLTHVRFETRDMAVKDVLYRVSGTDPKRIRVESETETEGIFEPDLDRVNAWLCPSWLHLTSLVKPDNAKTESPPLDAAGTRCQLLAIQRRLWDGFEGALETARLEAQTHPSKLTSSSAALKKPRKKPAQRQKLIWRAIKSGKEGRAYCLELDHLGVSIPASWVEDGCPAENYRQAYKDPNWKQKIWWERDNVKRAMTASEATSLTSHS